MAEQQLKFHLYCKAPSPEILRAIISRRLLTSAIAVTVAVGLFQFAHPTATGQSKTPKTRPRNVERVAIADPDTAALPPKYQGASFTDTFTAFKRFRSAQQKSQFETTADFKSRMQNLQGELLSFVLVNVEQSFDADNQVLKLELDYTTDYLTALEAPVELIVAFDRPSSADRNEIYLGSKFGVIKVIEAYKKLGSGIGRTALGLRKRYSKSQVTTAYLAMRFTNLFVSQSFHLPMSTSEARIFAGKVVVAITGRMRYPFSWEEFTYDSASLTDPYEVHYQKFYLFIEPESLVFFDYPTGRILSSLNLPLATGDSKALRLRLRRDRALPSQPTADVPSLTATTSPIPSPITIDPNRIYEGREVDHKARLISKPEPQYTEEARRNQITGTVVLKVVFASTGQVTDIQVVSGLPYGLSERAIAVAKLVKFIPAKKNGVPVSVAIKLEYNFNLY